MEKRSTTGLKIAITGHGSTGESMMAIYLVKE
jgi:hypothetical protein